MSEEILPFDRETPCPACGIALEIRGICRLPHPDLPAPDDPAETGPQEHLHVECAGCGWSWYMRPASGPAASKPSAEGGSVSYVVDFEKVSAVGLESSPVAPALAGLRANEARYFRNKYGHAFTVEPAASAEGAEIVDWVSGILREERGIVIESRPLEATIFEVEGTRWAYVFYESGLSINVLYTLEDAGKRAVGFKLSDGMEVPAELAKFKFARQKSKLAGTIRGSFFVIKGEH